jgi:hypothetical protein
MVMASPVSFGDAYLLATLALRLGRAFTKGRKSAPVEFREVENQLYSLGAALSALEDAKINGNLSRIPSNPQSSLPGEDDTVKIMLQGCRESLKHLEAIVEKYGIISQRQDSDQPLLRRWSRELKANWRKIAWTTEGGDLATLRSQLTVHANSLNLVLGVAIKFDSSISFYGVLSRRCGS